MKTETPGLRAVVGDAAPAEVLAALLDNGYPVGRGTAAPAGLTDVAVDATDADEALDQLEAGRRAADRPEPAGWKPWFPVIDFDRCTNCLQCLSFCLFDVYGVDESDQIQVQRADNCKTDCPACSRVCPDVAILFPKFRSGPLNGAPVNDEDVRREAMKVDISALLGGDIYQQLRDRSERARSRFSKERDEERALKERVRCLKKLKDQMDVPPEVLAALPSPTEIARRAAEAQARVDEVRQRQSDQEPDA